MSDYSSNYNNSALQRAKTVSCVLTTEKIDRERIWGKQKVKNLAVIIANQRAEIVLIRVLAFS